MSYENFKPAIWSQFIQRELEKKCKLVADCWKQFEGEVKHAKEVKILGVGSPTIGTYDGTSIGTPEAVETSDVMLKIDQAKFFNFMVDDVDRAQSVPGLMETLIKEATHKMAVTRDERVAKLAMLALDTGAGEYYNDKVISNSEVVKVGTEKAAKNAIDAALLALRENDVDIDDNVVIEVAPFFYQLLKNDLADLKTDNDELIRKGVVGYYDGAEVKLCNTIYKDDSGTYYNMIRTKKAIAFAGQIDSVEAYRPETLFSDAMKGLNVYGAKIIRPKELYVLKASK